MPCSLITFEGVLRTLTVYRVETWPVRVNPKKFNDHDNYSTLRLEHSACNQKIYKDMNYNKLLNFRVPFYSFGFRGCFASIFWECCR